MLRLSDERWGRSADANYYNYYPFIIKIGSESVGVGKHLKECSALFINIGMSWKMSTDLNVRRKMVSKHLSWCGGFHWFPIWNRSSFWSHSNQIIDTHPSFLTLNSVTILYIKTPRIANLFLCLKCATWAPRTAIVPLLKSELCSLSKPFQNISATFNF